MFVQHASGDFIIETGGEWHCGPGPERFRTLHYDVRVEFPDGALDSHGFLLDNQTYRHYFDSLGYTEVSCERLAKGACDHFCKLAPQASSVKVDIGVPGLADVEFQEQPKEVIHVASHHARVRAAHGAHRGE